MSKPLGQNMFDIIEKGDMVLFKGGTEEWHLTASVVVTDEKVPGVHGVPVVIVQVLNQTGDDPIDYWIEGNNLLARPDELYLFNINDFPQ